MKTTNPNKIMKNIMLFVLSMRLLFCLQVMTIILLRLMIELKHYKHDFTDTDGDGMTDVAELRYGFDPNDKNSYPNKDYTILSEFTYNLALHQSFKIRPTKRIKIRFY